MTADCFAGRLLVASPDLGDPNFTRAVLLLIEHSDAGALGVVLNHPTPLDVAEVLPSWEPYATGPGVLFQGGPVGLNNALALAAVPGLAEPLGWQRLSGGLGLVDLDAPPEVLVGELSAMRIFAGYAGWGPGQLEDEIAAGAWFVVDADARDAFDAHPDELWRAVLRRQPGDLALLSTYTEDPGLN